MSTRTDIIIKTNKSKKAVCTYRRNDGYPNGPHGVAAMLANSFQYVIPFADEWSLGDFSQSICIADKLKVIEDCKKDVRKCKAELKQNKLTKFDLKYLTERIERNQNLKERLPITFLQDSIENADNHIHSWYLDYSYVVELPDEIPPNEAKPSDITVYCYITGGNAFSKEIESEKGYKLTKPDKYLLKFQLGDTIEGVECSRDGCSYHTSVFSINDKAPKGKHYCTEKCEKIDKGQTLKYGIFFYDGNEKKEIYPQSLHFTKAEAIKQQKTWAKGRVQLWSIDANEKPITLIQS